MNLASETYIWVVAAIIALLVIVVFVKGFRSKADAPVDQLTTDASAVTTDPTPPTVTAADAGSPFLAEPDGEPDNLRQIKGIGPKLAARLQELGVFHFRQIADWSPEQLVIVDTQLGNFQGRPERDQWQSQARLLADQDIKAYEKLHGKLGG